MAGAVQRTHHLCRLAFLPRHTDAAYAFYRYSYFFMRDAGVLYSHYTDACAP